MSQTANDYVQTQVAICMFLEQDKYKCMFRQLIDASLAQIRHRPFLSLYASMSMSKCACINSDLHYIG